MAGLPVERTGFGARSSRPDESQARRARARIDSTVEPSVPAAPTGSRRLSEAERKALQERSQSRLVKADPTRAAVAAPTAPPAAPGRLRPVPKMPQPTPGNTVRSRPMVAFGTLLIVGLTILAFAGGRLFGVASGPPPTIEPPIAVAFGATPVLAIAPTPRPTNTPVPEVPAVPPPTYPGGQAPVVCLDAGHGGSDRGFARGPFGPLPPMEEATLTLEHAWDLEARLANRGFEAVMTREADGAVNADLADINGDGRTAADDRPGDDKYATLDELQARIDICNEARADLLVSMHVNGFTTQTPFGQETWYTQERPFGDRNQAFATLAYAHLSDQLGRIGYVGPEIGRGVNQDTASNVVMEYTLYEHFIMTGPAVPNAVEPSRMPGAIVEVLFVSNDGDAAVLASAEGRNAIVSAYENAIVEYFERYPPEPR
ncbi:MAG: N-acetylmuramoyl-L-alanine amidase [Chloroflexia bacterium]|nr:N-acetylmuramoyl-L-alanine amidase [Chloroflexia bacterium]